MFKRIYKNIISCRCPSDYAWEVITEFATELLEKAEVRYLNQTELICAHT